MFDLCHTSGLLDNHRNVAVSGGGSLCWQADKVGWVDDGHGASLVGQEPCDSVCCLHWHDSSVVQDGGRVSGLLKGLVHLFAVGVLQKVHNAVDDGGRVQVVVDFLHFGETVCFYIKGVYLVHNFKMLVSYMYVAQRFDSSEFR